MSVFSTKIKIVVVSTIVTIGLLSPSIASAQTRTNVAPQPMSFATPGHTNLSKGSYFNRSYVSLSHEFEKGVRQYNKGNMHLAKIAFKNVVDARKQKNYTQSIAFLGLIAAERDDHKTAIRHFKTALRGNPNIYGLKAALGLSYVELGEIKKAKATLEHMKRKQHRHYLNGSNEDEIRSSIQVLEQALLGVA